MSETRTIDDLPPESRAELEEFAAHLRDHRPVAQVDCQFCLLRLSRHAAAARSQREAHHRRVNPDGEDREGYRGPDEDIV